MSLYHIHHLPKDIRITMQHHREILITTQGADDRAFVDILIRELGSRGYTISQPTECIGHTTPGTDRTDTYGRRHHLTRCKCNLIMGRLSISIAHSSRSCITPAIFLFPTHGAIELLAVERFETRQQFKAQQVAKSERYLTLTMRIDILFGDLRIRAMA
jgi:hypothetical protein